MVIDSKGKLFGKISVVDVLIVVLIVGVIAGVGYKFTKSGTSTPFAKKNTITVTFGHNLVDNYKLDTIKVGDIVKDNQTGSEFGKVIDIKSDKSIDYASNSEGKYVASEKPNYSSITLVVEGDGMYNRDIGGQGVNFGGIDYFVGNSVELRVGDTKFWSWVKNLQKKG